MKQDLDAVAGRDGSDDSQAVIREADERSWSRGSDGNRRRLAAAIDHVAGCKGS